MASVLKLKTDIKKLKAAIASKATSGAIKTKLRGKLTTLENELDKLQPNKRKPKTTGPKSESALVKLAKKRRTNQGLSTSKNDIERDAIRPAKKAGKRTSANGNRYYEYRDNRVDNRQPPKKYRKLADGGHMADGGEVEISEIPRRIKYLDYDGGPNDKRLHYQESRTFGAENKEDYDDATEQIDKIEYKGNGWKLFVVYDVSGYQYWMKSQEEQNYMQITIAFDKYTIDKAEIPKIEAALMEAVNDIEDIAYRYDYIPSDDNYKKGGYMAKGGKTKDQEVVRGYFEDEAYEYAKGGEVMYLSSNGTSQTLVTDKSNATPMWIMDAEYYISSNPKNNSMMVAEKIDETLPDRVGKNYIVKITKKNKMDDGGSVAKGNYEMLMSQAKEVMHHAEELMKVAKPDMDVEAWVVAKAERATTDLSDITHYLDGLKMAMGGMVKHNEHKVNA